MHLTLGMFRPDLLGQAANLTMEDRLTHRSYIFVIFLGIPLRIQTVSSPANLLKCVETDKSSVVFKAFFPGSILTKKISIKKCCGTARIQIFWLLDF
jgi:hypothetical protein